MALTNLYKSYCMSNYVFSTLRNSFRTVLIRRKTALIDFDILDDFTTQLMQKKINKWENIKIRKHLAVVPAHTHPSAHILGDKLKEISQHELELIVENIINENDQSKLCTLVEECTTYKRKVSDFIIINILRNFAQSAYVKGINKVQTLCLVISPEYLQANSNFKNYLAEAIWVKGNTTKALELFEEVYHENHFLRRRIRLAVKFLISTTVFSQSEAVLVNLVKFTEKLVKEYKDYYLLICLWQMCFLSEWFSDQQLALELIERNEGLCRVLVNVIPNVVYSSLKYHKIDPVYRLLEILLKHDMKTQYSTVLIALFDYKYKQGDLKSCCEILNWSVKYNITFKPANQYINFLRLLLKCDVDGQQDQGNTFTYDLKF